MIRHLEIVACFLKTRQCRPNPILKAFIHISICLRQKQKEIPIILESNIHHFSRQVKQEKWVFFFEIQHWNPRNVLKG